MELKPSHSGGFSFFNQFTTGTNRSGAVLAGQLLMADTGRQNAASLNMNEGDGASGYANFVAPYLNGTLQGGANGLYGIVVASVADASPVKLQISGKCQAWIRCTSIVASNVGKDVKLGGGPVSNVTNTTRLLDNTGNATGKLIGKLEDDLTAILTVALALGNGAGALDGPESGYFTGVATASVALAGILFEGINGMR